MALLVGAAWHGWKVAFGKRSREMEKEAVRGERPIGSQGLGHDQETHVEVGAS